MDNEGKAFHLHPQYAQSGDRGIALLNLDSGARRG
jgi:hypothetical protein